MYHSCTLHSTQRFKFDEFAEFIGSSSQMVLWGHQNEDDNEEWFFYRTNHSTTSFMIQFTFPNTYTISMDYLASASDYHFYPYLLDGMAQYLNSHVNEVDKGENLYATFNDEWMESMIGEEIAQLKASLSVCSRYYISISLPTQPFAYISTDVLKNYGVCLNSSTPRIYGYIQYMLTNRQIPISTYEEMTANDGEISEEFYEVDVPQHHSIGTVKSWQLDGSETTESYSKEDVRLLLSIADNINKGNHYEGVVINDIGTIYQEGIGIKADFNQAAQWFMEAYEAGDHLYAPTNLGDLYRKGKNDQQPDLAKALYWYQKSDDPYAWYRIGQAIEEGWVAEPNLEQAMPWYQKAAEVGHHLALKRIQRNRIE